MLQNKCSSSQKRRTAIEFAPVWTGLAWSSRIPLWKEREWAERWGCWLGLREKLRGGREKLVREPVPMGHRQARGGEGEERILRAEFFFAATNFPPIFPLVWGEEEEAASFLFAEDSSQQRLTEQRAQGRDGRMLLDSSSPAITPTQRAGEGRGRERFDSLSSSTHFHRKPPPHHHHHLHHHPHHYHVDCTLGWSFQSPMRLRRTGQNWH